MKTLQGVVGALLMGVAFSVWIPSAHAFGPVTGDITGPVANIVLSGNDAVRLLPGANVAYIYAYDQSRVDVLAGDLSYLYLHDNSTANISGGEISWLHVKDSSRANLTQATDLSWLILSGSGDAHLYGTNFRYSGGQIYGRWPNGAALNFWAFFDDDLSTPPVLTSVVPAGLHLHVVPEPHAMALAMTVWCLAVNRRRACRKRSAAPLDAGGAK